MIHVTDNLKTVQAPGSSKIIDKFTVCLLVGFFLGGGGCLGFIWRRHHYSANTNYDTGQPFIMVISKDPRHTHIPVAERLAVDLSLPVFKSLGMSRTGIEPRSPACETNALPLRHLKFNVSDPY